MILHLRRLGLLTLGYVARYTNGDPSHIQQCCVPEILSYTRHSKSNVWKSDSIELNWTQSMDWVRLSSAIEPNQTLNFLWVRFPNQSNLIKQIEPNRTQSDTIEWPDDVRLALVNPYKASPKQSHQSRFFLCHFTIYSITETPFINCPRQLREKNRTEQSYHYSRGRIPKLLYPFHLS